MEKIRRGRIQRKRRQGFPEKFWNISQKKEEEGLAANKSFLIFACPYTFISCLAKSNI